MSAHSKESATGKENGYTLASAMAAASQLKFVASKLLSEL